MDRDRDSTAELDRAEDNRAADRIQGTRRTVCKYSSQNDFLYDRFLMEGTKIPSHETEHADRPQDVRLVVLGKISPRLWFPYLAAAYELEIDGQAPICLYLTYPVVVWRLEV